MQKTYTCPMHPEIRRDAPGMCPECGMQLLPETKDEMAHEGPGAHDKHAGHSTVRFKHLFFMSLILSIPVVLYSDIVATLLGWRPPVFPGSAYVPAILASVIFFTGGRLFIASAIREIRARLPGMMTLIAIAIIAAYGYSIANVLLGKTETLFWELATLITAMLLGHWLEMRAVKGAQSALQELAKLLPDTAEVVHGEHTMTVPLDQVKVGDLVLVRPGGKVPTDGTITEGSSDVDESIATGESRPVPKRVGDSVIAGTANGDGILRVIVTQIGEHTFLAGVMRLVSEAQASKSRLQLLSDRAAFLLTVVAVTVGSFTLVGWLVAQATAGFAVQRFVAVLVISCPHALGLAVPLVASISTSKAARSGFLVRQRLALEAARDIDIVLFDKTGTLTEGAYGVTDVWPINAANARELLRLAASVDAGSEHVVARALVRKAEHEGIALTKVSDYQRLKGVGSQATVEGKRIIVGGTQVVGTTGLSTDLARTIDREAQKGKTIIYAVGDGLLLGAFGLADIIREESRDAIAQLKRMGVRTAMVTGDAQAVASWVARELDIDEYFAQVKPDEKAQKVKLLQQQGHRVAMVGDGINDAPALAAADVGIAIGAGTNVAIESAGIILVRNDPRDIPKIVRLSRLTYRKMVQNLWWAAGYNIIAIPLAAGVLASRGILLQPAIAALLMSASTVIVAFNAVLLKRQRL